MDTYFVIQNWTWIRRPTVKLESAPWEKPQTRTDTRDAMLGGGGGGGGGGVIAQGESQIWVVISFSEKQHSPSFVHVLSITWRLHLTNFNP